jgi:uncharacterized protein (TIGR03086 family)
MGTVDRVIDDLRMIDELRQALGRLAGIFDGVSVDDYERPTPCTEYDVRTLMNHIVAGNLMFGSVARGENLDLSVFEQEHLDDDPPGAFRRSAELALAGWQRPGALEENLGFGNLPGATVIRMHLVEALAHGWDLAQATGQDPKFDPHLAEVALEAMRAMPQELVRGGGFFGTEIPIDEHAPPVDRLVAFLGRDPATHL